jgi:Predicted amidohydrolase
MNFREVRLGVMICEDMWTPEVTETLGESGAEILLVPNGSPYEHAKYDERIQLAAARTVESNLPIIYVNQIGGQDELVFDGASFALDADATLKAQLPAWQEAVALTRWRRSNRGWHCAEGEIVEPRFGLAGIYQAMMLGLRDYVEKNRFPGVVLGSPAASIPPSAPPSPSTRWGRPGCGPHAALALYQPRQPGGCRRLRDTRWASASTRSPSSRPCRPSRACWPRSSTAAPRHDRGEHPEPRPRRHPHGLLQQARTYGALHRQ